MRKSTLHGKETIHDTHDQEVDNFSEQEKKEAGHLFEKIMKIAETIGQSLWLTAWFSFLTIILRWALSSLSSSTNTIDLTNSHKKKINLNSLKSNLIHTLSVKTIDLAHAHNKKEANLDSLKSDFILNLSDAGFYDYSKFKNVSADKIKNMDHLLTENIVPQLPYFTREDFEWRLFLKDFEYYNTKRRKNEWWYHEILTMDARGVIFDIMSSDAFKHTVAKSYDKLSFNRIFSLAQAICRWIWRFTQVEDIPHDKFQELVDWYVDQLTSFEKTVIVSKDTKICAISTDEFTQGKDSFIDRYRTIGWTSQNILANESISDTSHADVVQQQINAFLEGIAQSHQWETCIFVDSHGSESETDEENNYSVGLGYYPTGKADSLWCKITPKALGDAMIRSGDTLSNFRVILPICYGYNFANRLFDYLKTHNAKGAPIVLTRSNESKVAVGRFGIDDMFMTNEQRANKKELIWSDFLDVEDSWLFTWENDPAFFIPMPYGKPDALGKQSKNQKYLEISENKPEENDITIIEAW